MKKGWMMGWQDRQGGGTRYTALYSTALKKGEAFIWEGERTNWLFYFFLVYVCVLLTFSDFQHSSVASSSALRPAHMATSLSCSTLKGRNMILISLTPRTTGE